MIEKHQSVAYVISAIEGIKDQEIIKRYAEITGPAIKHFGGHFIVSNSEPIIIEGESTTRHLSIVQFRNMENAKAWYDSPEYAEARNITPNTFEGRVLMFVQGV